MIHDNNTWQYYCVLVWYIPQSRDRVLSFFSSRRNWDSPTPSPAGDCAPSPLIPGGGEGHTRLRERGWGSPNSNKGTYTVVLHLYLSLVVFSLHHRIHLHVFCKPMNKLRYRWSHYYRWAEFWKEAAEEIIWDLASKGLEMRRKLSQINKDDLRLSFYFILHRNTNIITGLELVWREKPEGWDGGNLWSSEDGGGGREGVGGSHQLILGQCCGQLKYSSMAVHTSCWTGFCQVRFSRYLYMLTYCSQGSLQYGMSPKY
jgi:hypothetical protein